MKGDIKVPTAKSVSVEAAAQQTKKALTKLKTESGSGSASIQLEVLGRNVDFKLQIVDAGHVEKKTMVLLQNERDQDLLDEFAIADLIESFDKNGQQVPAFGREVNGVIEVADGSRRRFTAIHTKKPFKVFIADLSDAEMIHLSEIGNYYSSPSAYEKGKRYLQMLQEMSQEAVMKAVGLSSRQPLMRMANTARIPKSIIELFPKISELSARKGDELYKKINESNGESKARLVDMIEHLQANKGAYDADEIIQQIYSCLTPYEKIKPEIETRELPNGGEIKINKGKATIKLPKLNEDEINKIESYISTLLNK